MEKTGLLATIATGGGLNASITPGFVGKRRDDASGHGYTLRALRHADSRREDGSKKKAPVLGERELKVNFRKSDTSANALIHFNAPDNLKSTSVIKLYDVDNHPAGVGKVEKLSLSRGESLERSWQLPLFTLAPGI
jgi:hypothetical protein